MSVASVWHIGLGKPISTFNTMLLHHKIDDIRKKEGISADFAKLELALAEYAEKNEVRIWRQV